MKKMKGSSNYLRNQVTKNLVKAALCLVAFCLIFFAIVVYGLLTLSFNVFEAAGLLVSLVPLGVFYYYLRKYRIYNGGWSGEKQVAKLLSRTLSDDYTLLNDLYLRNGAGDIDHVVLAPSGVFVLETKNWSGVISCNGDEWQRAGKRSFHGNPSVQVKRNAAQIRRVLDSDPSLRSLNVRVEGIVVFTNNHSTLHLNDPTVEVVKLPQLPNYLVACGGVVKLSQEQLKIIGEAILSQRS